MMLNTFSLCTIKARRGQRCLKWNTAGALLSFCSDATSLTFWPNLAFRRCRREPMFLPFDRKGEREMRRGLQKKKNKKKKKSYRWIAERNGDGKREGEDVEGNERLLMGLPTKTINLRHAQYALSNIQDFPDYFLDLDTYASSDMHNEDVPLYALTIYSHAITFYRWNINVLFLTKFFVI